MDIEEIEGELYEVRKLKQLYYLGYGENIVYMINLETQKSKFRRME